MALWLLACCALIFAMVVLGGVTRLTGSGLSMVNWKPLTGIVPPLSQSSWEEEFAHYQRSPEYQQVNRGMSLAQFKRIFWFEYGHRLLGRLIGFAFAIPFLYFFLRKQIPLRLVPRLVLMFLLGGLQGVLGWYMVKSGLVDDPHVSQYRLAAHLGLAALVYGFILWTALGLLLAPSEATQKHPTQARRCFVFATVLAGAVFLTMVSGAFVAGLKAGLIYNTFPLMGGEWLPPNLWVDGLGLLNFFENVTTVQFNHRLLALSTFASILVFWWHAWRSPLGPMVRWWLHGAAAAAVIQVALGIATLLLRVPIALGALHQAGALILLTVLVTLAARFKVQTPSAPRADQRTA